MQSTHEIRRIGAATLHHGDSLQVLSQLAQAGLQVDALITDPPYSSGGMTRSDRMQSPVSKYIQSGSAALDAGYSFIRIEQDRHYFDVAAKRVHDHVTTPA